MATKRIRRERRPTAGVCAVVWCCALTAPEATYCAVHRKREWFDPNSDGINDCRWCDGKGICFQCDGTGRCECGCGNEHRCEQCWGNGKCDVCKGKDVLTESERNYLGFAFDIFPFPLPSPACPWDEVTH